MWWKIWKVWRSLGEVNTAYIVFQHPAGLVATFASERCSNPVPLSSETSSNVLVLPAVYHAHTSWAKGFWMHQAVPVRCSAMVIGNSRCFKTVCRPVLNLAASCSTRVADLQSDDGTVHSWSCPPFGRQVTAVGLRLRSVLKKICPVLVTLNF